MNLSKCANNINSVRWLVESVCANGVSITSGDFEIDSDSALLDINGTRFDGADAINMSTGKHFTALFSSNKLISEGDNNFVIDWKCNPQIGREGLIEVLNYENNQNVRWEVESDCTNIHVVSQFFATEEYGDYVIINGQTYSGEVNISQIITRSNFVADFHSDEINTNMGLRLNWFCLTGPFEEQTGTEIF